MKKLFQQISVGFKRHPWRFVISIFLTYTVLWTIIESSAFFFNSLALSGAMPYLVIVGFSIVVGIYRSAQPRYFQFKIGNTDTGVTVSFGDLFASTAYKTIPVNEFFDTKLGKPVSQKSIHGAFISRYFGGHGSSLNALVDRSLSGESFEIVRRSGGRGKRYPIGTTAVVPVDDDIFYLVALSRTDLKTAKAYADIPELWDALVGLWNQVRVSAGGHTVAVPLIGGGLSGIGLPGTQLVQLIILSIVNESKKRKITNEICVILPEESFGEIDLELVKNIWK